jgi:hypothetical protein
MFVLLTMVPQYPAMLVLITGFPKSLEEGRKERREAGK